MFDWFNPKPTNKAAAAEEKTKNEEDDKTKAEEEEDQTTSKTKTIHTGTVTWYSTNKGFGFIKPSSSDSSSSSSSDGDDEESTTPDIFVHQSEIQAPGYRFLIRNEPVEYQISDDGKGRTCAINVTGPNGGDVKITIKRKQRQQLEADKEKS